MKRGIFIRWVTLHFFKLPGIFFKFYFLFPRSFLCCCFHYSKITILPRLNMAQKKYKLSSTIFGHTSDVRCIATTQGGEIITGARDLSAKLWGTEQGGKYVEKAIFNCHTNFVSSVCYLPASERHPDGVIVTGSNDKQIRLFDPLVTNPFKILKNHTNTVCKVIPATFGWTFLSASWDLTARAWREENNEWISAVFSGHKAAVWSVCQLSLGLVVTASADRTLRVYGESGDFQRELKGHTDCVRDVVTAGSEEVLSVANDASIRHWNVISAVCLNTYYGHGHYIYSISMLPGIGWVTSSEDKTVKIWGPTGEVDSITLPCASVWAASVLPNSDIVTGSNDGAIRIFTLEPTRTADAVTLADYQEQVTKMLNEAAQEVGGVKLAELPGPEALSTPGKTDGQTKLVREGNKAVAYSWSSEKATWEQIGDVVGSGGGNASETNRPVHNGKEYDYVFNVDIEEGKPPLKLPYNKIEDPWVVAQRFIHDEDLPQSYLEQVANFIVSNSDQQPSTLPQADFVDPFTGGSRYVPQSNSSNPTRNDPTESPSNLKATKYFPQREFLRFDQANVAAIKDKLITLNNDHNLGVLEAEIEELLQKCDASNSCSPADLDVLNRMLQWPKDKVFPVLDVLRLVIRQPTTSKIICCDNFLATLEPHLEMHPNNLLVLRICSNMMSTHSGEMLSSKYRLKLLGFLISCDNPLSKFNQVALATLLLNISVMMRRDGPDGIPQALWACKMISLFNDEEAVFRGLVALGTLLYDTSNQKLMGNSLLSILNEKSSASTGRIRDCANEILSFIKS